MPSILVGVMTDEEGLKVAGVACAGGKAINNKVSKITEGINKTGRR